MNNISLFLDTSSFIQIGLLNEDQEWAAYELIKNKKGSQVLHSLIYELLIKHNLSIKDIKRLIVANGPGSYTGIRLAEGFAQILELENIEVINFYHYEAPFFAGKNNYGFVANAFKGETFSYTFNATEEETMKLLSSEEFDNFKSSEEIYHIGEEVNGKSFQSLYRLYEDEPSRIFSKVIQREARTEPFYFRPLEKEFKPSILRTTTSE